MNVKKPIPIGIEDFKEIIDIGYYFVDKTLLIKDLIDNRAKVSLITRPRRFGKTLNMSMIQRFFENTKESNAYLFENLKISKEGEQYLKYQGKYPVITLSLKSLKQENFDYALYQFEQVITSEFARHSHILKSNKLSPNNRKKFEEIYTGNVSDKTMFYTSLKLLSECLNEVTQEKVVVLIDEYDVPLENAYFCGFYDEMVNFVRSLFESVLKTNTSLEFAILTGCMRISKESIFTGLNNLATYPITRNKLSEYYGFTQNEVEEFAKDYDLFDKLPEMKQWYDGYQFGKNEIYNPWSIIQYISYASEENEIACRPYWINTSSNSIIHQLISQSDEKTKKKIEELISGGSIKAVINENTVYSDIDVNNEDIWSFLLFTGYLKQINSEIVNDNTVSELVIPNVEIRSVYKNVIVRWFEESVRNNGTSEIFDAMLSEDTEKMEDEISKWLRKSISYHDTKENFYHGFLAGLLTGRDGYEVKSNRENGNGRSDITVCEYSQRKVAVIFEVKPADSFKQLEEKCEQALKQIEEEKYAQQFIDDCYKKVISYGIAFSGKSCKVKIGKTLYYK